MIYIRKHDLLRLISLIGGNGRFCEISFCDGVFSIDSFCSYRMVVRCPGQGSEQSETCAAIVKTSALAAAVSMCPAIVSIEFSGNKTVVTGDNCRTVLKSIPIKHDYQVDVCKSEDIFAADLLSVAAEVQRTCNVLSSSHANRRTIRIARNGSNISITAANDTNACIGTCAITTSHHSPALDICVPPQAIISLYSSSLGSAARIRMAGKRVEISTKQSRVAAIYAADSKCIYPKVEIVGGGAATEESCGLHSYNVLRSKAGYILLAERRRLHVQPT